MWSRGGWWSVIVRHTNSMCRWLENWKLHVYPIPNAHFFRVPQPWSLLQGTRPGNGHNWFVIGSSRLNTCLCICKTVCNLHTGHGIQQKVNTRIISNQMPCHVYNHDSTKIYDNNLMKNQRKNQCSTRLQSALQYNFNTSSSFMIIYVQCHDPLSTHYGYHQWSNVPH